MRIIRSTPFALRFLLAGLLLAHAGMILYSARQNSVTLDEAAHIPAGLSHWVTGTFTMYRVNPPLPRMLAVLPVLALSPNLESCDLGYDHTPGARTEAPAAGRFAWDNVAAYHDFVFLARLAGIGWSLIAGLVIYCWATDLYGPRAGLCGVAVWCFDPNIIANAQLVTPDIPAASAAVLSSYAFWRYVRQASWRRAWLAGLLLGIAELTKFTLLVLYVLWPLLWLASRSQQAAVSFARVGWRVQCAHAALIVLLSVAVINLGYGFEGTGRPLKDFSFVSGTFAGAGSLERGLPGNRFEDSVIGRTLVPLPAEFLLGIDRQRLDFERGFPCYLGGEWSDGGWWYYYFYALLVKVPVGGWIVIILAGALTLRHSAGFHNELTLLLPIAVILALLSANPGVSHLRYALPIFPFAIIWLSKVARAFELRQYAAAAFAGVALVWSVWSSLSVYPHSLSYFNEFAGGPKGGPSHLLESDMDWGQDLLYLRDWLNEHPETRPIGLVYFGSVDPRVIGIAFTLPPKLSLEPVRRGLALEGPQPGWYALSVNYLKGALQMGAFDGHGAKERFDKPCFTYFNHFAPVATAGYSIYIYHVTLEDANRVRRELGLPELAEEVMSHE